MNATAAMARTAPTAATVPQTDAGSSSPEGRVPRTTSSANASEQTTASNEARPCSAQ